MPLRKSYATKTYMRHSYNMRSGNNDGIRDSIQRSIQIESESILSTKHPLPNKIQNVRCC